MLSLADDLQVIGEASNGQEAIQAVATVQSDVVLMDVRTPMLDGLDATRQIKVRWPDVKIIIFTMYDAEEEDAMAAGGRLFSVEGKSQDCSRGSHSSAIVRNSTSRKMA